jgi:hypothetical protein
LIVVIIIILILVLAGPVYMYVHARQVVSIDVRALTLDEILDIGTKNSESAFRRMRGRAKIFHSPDLAGGVVWAARNGHVYTTYMAMPLSGNAGYRIGAGVQVDKIYQMFSLQEMQLASNIGRAVGWEHGAAYYAGGQVGSWLGQKIWLWSHARKVLFRRWRTFSELKKADARRAAILPASSQVTSPSQNQPSFPNQNQPSSPGQ